MTYKTPLNDMLYCLNSVIQVQDLLEQPKFAEFDTDLWVQILDEAAKFADEVIAPTDRTCDQIGAKLSDEKKVVVPEILRPVYKAFVEGGWQGAAFDAEIGGMGLPRTIGLAINEAIGSANMAFSLCPMLTAGAIEAINAHGSDEQKAEYLEKLLTGEWTGTMNLTEPQAGSDVGALTTKAIPQADGTYKIYGQKIFITWGDHDLTENTIHLVLARLPDAPAGTRGISLFIVPKFLKDAAGNYTIRNDAGPIGVEHKLGIHSSPTCVMAYGEGIWGDEKGAIGYLIGGENAGMRCMFTMMNNARLNVGLQGVSVSEAALQKAKSYAHDRRQGKALGDTETSSPIIKHPDIQRSILTMHAKTMAARGICYLNAFAIDMKECLEGDEKAKWTSIEGILTPISKAFSTDIGVDNASLGVQVHGGMGFIEETGAAQYLRDARIAPIYEGTNSIQAIDLIGRKLAFDKGQGFGYISEIITSIANDAASSAEHKTALLAALDNLDEVAKLLIQWQSGDGMQSALIAANYFLEAAGTVLGAALLLKGKNNAATGPINHNFKNASALCDFYFANILPSVISLCEKIKIGNRGINEYDYSI